MITDRITWYRANRPKRSGLLHHKFTVSGPHAREVLDWLTADNDHSEWLLPGEVVGERFTFHIYETTQDAEASRRTRDRIMMLKMRWAGSPDGVEFCEHRRP